LTASRPLIEIPLTVTVLAVPTSLSAKTASVWPKVTSSPATMPALDRVTSALSLRS